MNWIFKLRCETRHQIDLYQIQNNQIGNFMLVLGTRSSSTVKLWISCYPLTFINDEQERLQRKKWSKTIQKSNALVMKLKGSLNSPVLLQAPFASSSMRNPTITIWYVRGNIIIARSDVFRYRTDLSPVKVAKKLSTGEGLAMLVALVTPRAKLKVRYIAETRKCNVM